MRGLESAVPSSPTLRFWLTMYWLENIQPEILASSAMSRRVATFSKEFISSHFEVFVGCTPWNVPLVTFAL